MAVTRRHRWGFPCFVSLLGLRAVAITPVGPLGACIVHFPSDFGLPHDYGVSAPTLVFSRPAQRSLTLRPTNSRSRPRRPFPPEALTASLPPPSLRLLPARTTVAGRELHPLKKHAFTAHVIHYCPFKVGPASQSVGADPCLAGAPAVVAAPSRRKRPSATSPSSDSWLDGPPVFVAAPSFHTRAETTSARVNGCFSKAPGWLIWPFGLPKRRLASSDVPPRISVSGACWTATRIWRGDVCAFPACAWRKDGGGVSAPAPSTARKHAVWQPIKRKSAAFQQRSRPAR